jgi:hypothetical protein
MFVGFFYYLRARGLKVSRNEWLTLMQALVLGLPDESLTRFYFLCRSLCIKSEDHFDAYDQCFAEYFRDAEVQTSIKDEILDWLENPIFPRDLDPEEMQRLKELDLDELRRQFEERMAEQNERHDGGNRWVGTGGTSPFGHSGQHPSGIRVGGESRQKSAMQIAAARVFRNLRSDLVLDTRSIGVALRQLRQWGKEGATDELDIEATIDATAKNAGDIEMIMRKSRQNSVKLMLLMDVGGSMTVYTRLCETLFSAAHGLNHFKMFKTYYFHNCPYDYLYTDMQRGETVPTIDVLREMDETWFLLVVGDAAMNPMELTVPGGCIDYFFHNEEPGIAWLQLLRQKMPRSIWLNPDPEAYWNIASNRLVRSVFSDMYPLTVDGIRDGMQRLMAIKS